MHHYHPFGILRIAHLSPHSLTVTWDLDDITVCIPPTFLHTSQEISKSKGFDNDALSKGPSVSVRDDDASVSKSNISTDIIRVRAPPKKYNAMI